MAALHTYLSGLLPSFQFRITNHSEGDISMILLGSVFVFFTFFVLILSFSLYKRLRKIELEQHQQLISKPSETDPIDIGHYLARCDDTTNRRSPTCLPHSLLFEILPADSPKWASLFSQDDQDDADSKGFGSDTAVQEQSGKRKKKRAKKKRTNSPSPADDGAGEETENWGINFGSRSEQELKLLCPFTSSSSVMQRQIKQQYDELMKCHESKELTLAQVRQFANCLINTRSKLQHKADVIHRKFTITKALLYKADRSSFDRFRQQIYKLELEQKRLEEDTFVYNWLQQQLKFSPAYKKMLEIDTGMELMEQSEKATESTDSDFTDMSFEELLAQEKKDSFWQRNGKLRSSSN